MFQPTKTKRLSKELGLLNVYAIATGTTLSAGFFLLPGIAAAQAGPALILSYIIAAIPLVPAMFCMIELSTAMPRAGGAYYFLDRSLGPLIGTIGGFGTWLSLMLKTAFALVGMGAYLNLFIPGNYMMPIAFGAALFFGMVNLVGAKETGSIQIFLVAGILALVGGFIFQGCFNINATHFSNFYDAGAKAIISTAGLVYISFVGVTNIASISEEVKNPERNLPLGMFLAFATAIVIYILGTFVIVGVLPMEQLENNLTPVASVAEHMMGWWGKVLVTIAAIFAFSSVTNAGIMSASRYPLAMSRDHILPRIFRKLNKRNIPITGVLVTLISIMLCLVFFDPAKIAKLASSFQLLIFAFCCLAVIIMRESKIDAYDPGFRSPWYPWLPIFGIISPAFIIFEMGHMSILFSTGLIAVGIGWYFLYARQRVIRQGALLHVFERLGRQRYEGLEPELREILKEKGLRADDPFNELIIRAQFLDIKNEQKFDTVIKKAAKLLSERITYSEKKIVEDFLQGSKIGATPVSRGVALPHMRLNNIIEPELLLVRSKKGIDLNLGAKFWGEHTPDIQNIKAVFFLISPEDDPAQHLRILANIANRVDDNLFLEEWLGASNEQELKEILLREDHFLSIYLQSGRKYSKLIGKMLKELQMPKDCLVALIHRGKKTIVPRGSTVLEKGDRLTVIGNEKGIEKFRSAYNH